MVFKYNKLFDTHLAALRAANKANDLHACMHARDEAKAAARRVATTLSVCEPTGWLSTMLCYVVLHMIKMGLEEAELTVNVLSLYLDVKCMYERAGIEVPQKS